MALADLLRAESNTTASVSKTHHAPRAKHVIFLFMAGGPSHLDLFDFKPSLKKFAGQRPAGADLRTERVTGGLLPAPWDFQPGGQSGLLISDLLPQLRECADDLCVVRSVVGGNPNHAPAATPTTRRPRRIRRTIVQRVPVGAPGVARRRLTTPAATVRGRGRASPAGRGAGGAPGQGATAGGNGDGATASDRIWHDRHAGAVSARADCARGRSTCESDQVRTWLARLRWETP